MARKPFQTLTEPMFYILLCLNKECCGTDILEQIPTITSQRIRISPGTLYTILKQFLEFGMIRETRTEKKRRYYVITATGRDLLHGEYMRLQKQVKDAAQILSD